MYISIMLDHCDIYTYVCISNKIHMQTISDDNINDNHTEKNKINNNNTRIILKILVILRKRKQQQ